MDKVFKISGAVTYLVEHDCDCEFCEHRGDERKSDSVNAAVFADTLTHARASVIHDYFSDDAHMFDWSSAVVEEVVIPPGRLFLISGRILTGDGYTSDGFIALHSSFVFGTHSTMVGKDKDDVSIAVLVESAPPIGEQLQQKQADQQQYLKFSDGNGFEVTIQAKYAEMVKRIGAGLYKTGGIDRPLAIVRDGQHIGLVMPIYKVR